MKVRHVRHTGYGIYCSTIYSTYNLNLNMKMFSYKNKLIS